MKVPHLVLLFSVVLVSGRPNFLILYADDLGIGDVGCFGNDTIRTPNIDRMCEEGAKLSHHLAAAATCTPSRTALLTGRYPVRAGLAANDGLDVIAGINHYTGLPVDEITFPKILQSNGYYNGLIGKWHIGIHSQFDGDYGHFPTKHGFDYFFGNAMTNHRALGPEGSDVVWMALPYLKRNFLLTAIVGVITGWFIKQRFSRTAGLSIMVLAVAFPSWMLYIIYNAKSMDNGLWRNEEIVEQPINFDSMTQRFINEGYRFLKNRQDDGKPFLLMMSWNQVHTFLHSQAPFKGISKHGRYGDEIEEMDWSVGEMLKGLKKFGFEKNTVVYFSSDNGGHLEEYEFGYRAGGHNGIFRGGKFQGGQEGGIRMPTAIYWPDKIPAGVDISEPTSQLDIFPTFLAMAGINAPQGRILDGYNILPLIQGKEEVSPHKFLFHYCGNRIHAVRYRPQEGVDTFKVHFFWPNWDEGAESCGQFACNCFNDHFKLDQPKLYNIAHDPGERHELDISSAKYRKMLKVIDSAKTDHKRSIEAVSCQYDLWYSMYRPWLHFHTCCNFPHCACIDKDNALELEF